MGEYLPNPVDDYFSYRRRVASLNESIYRLELAEAVCKDGPDNTAPTLEELTFLRNEVASSRDDLREAIIIEHNLGAVAFDESIDRLHQHEFPIDCHPDQAYQTCLGQFPIDSLVTFELERGQGWREAVVAEAPELMLRTAEGTESIEVAVTIGLDTKTRYDGEDESHDDYYFFFTPGTDQPEIDGLRLIAKPLYSPDN